MDVERMVEAGARAIEDAIDWMPDMFERRLLAVAARAALTAALADAEAQGAVLVVVPEMQPMRIDFGVYANERRTGYNAAIADTLNAKVVL